MRYQQQVVKAHEYEHDREFLKTIYALTSWVACMLKPKIHAGKQWLLRIYNMSIYIFGELSDCSCRMMNV